MCIQPTNPETRIKMLVLAANAALDEGDFSAADYYEKAASEVAYKAGLITWTQHTDFCNYCDW